MSDPALPPHRSPRTAFAAVISATLVVVLLAACGDDGTAAATTTTTTTQAPTPSEVLATCSPAEGSDFVAIEKHHLTHGAHHLGQGFISADGPDGHYLAANLYSIDNVQLATGLVWRINPDGTALSAVPEDDAWDVLPNVPDAEITAHPDLIACTKAALATG